ncbi:unnamed protein product [Musa acuminata var. zebrina]
MVFRGSKCLCHAGFNARVLISTELVQSPTQEGHDALFHEDYQKDFFEGMHFIYASKKKIYIFFLFYFPWFRGCKCQKEIKAQSCSSSSNGEELHFVLGSCDICSLFA